MAGGPMMAGISPSGGNFYVTSTTGRTSSFSGNQLGTIE
jgi:hypothetical protein